MSHTVADSSATQAVQVIEDTRPLIEDLLRKHREGVDKARDSVGDARLSSPSTVPYDDIFLLRFVMSNDSVEEAAAAAVQAIEYRAAHAELFERLAAGQPYERQEAILKYTPIETHLTHQGGPLFIVRAGRGDSSGLMSTFSEEEVLTFLQAKKEEAFLICDRATRASGRLTKMLSVTDLNGAGLFSFNRKFGKLLGRHGKASEVVYPQLVERACLVNLPTVFNAIWAVAKRLFSKKMVEKTALCSARTDAGEDPVLCCPFVRSRLRIDDLPDFLGGARSAPSLEAQQRAGPSLEGPAAASGAGAAPEGGAAPVTEPTRA